MPRFVVLVVLFLSWVVPRAIDASPPPVAGQRITDAHPLLANLPTPRAIGFRRQRTSRGQLSMWGYVGSVSRHIARQPHGFNRVEVFADSLSHLELARNTIIGNHQVVRFFVRPTAEELARGADGSFSLETRTDVTGGVVLGLDDQGNLIPGAEHITDDDKTLIEYTYRRLHHRDLTRWPTQATFCNQSPPSREEVAENLVAYLPHARYLGAERSSVSPLRNPADVRVHHTSQYGAERISTVTLGSDPRLIRFYEAFQIDEGQGRPAGLEILSDNFPTNWAELDHLRTRSLPPPTGLRLPQQPDADPLAHPGLLRATPQSAGSFITDWSNVPGERQHQYFWDAASGEFLGGWERPTTDNKPSQMMIVNLGPYLPGQTLFHDLQRQRILVEDDPVASIGSTAPAPIPTGELDLGLLADFNEHVLSSDTWRLPANVAIAKPAKPNSLAAPIRDLRRSVGRSTKIHRVHEGPNLSRSSDRGVTTIASFLSPFEALYVVSVNLKTADEPVEHLLHAVRADPTNPGEPLPWKYVDLYESPLLSPE